MAVLATIGGLSLLAGATLAAVVSVQAYRKHVPGKESLGYIVNWADLGDSVKITEVVHSYSSERNWVSGDRLNFYCLRLDKPLADLDRRTPETDTWVHAPVSDRLLLEAIKTATTFSRNGAPWFPEEGILNSRRFFLSFPQVTAYHGRVEAVDLTAYDTQEHLLYHAEVRW